MSIPWDEAPRNITVADYAEAKEEMLRLIEQAGGVDQLHDLLGGMQRVRFPRSDGGKDIFSLNLYVIRANVKEAKTVGRELRVDDLIVPTDEHTLEYSIADWKSATEARALLEKGERGKSAASRITDIRSRITEEEQRQAVQDALETIRKHGGIEALLEKHSDEDMRITGNYGGEKLQSYSLDVVAEALRHAQSQGRPPEFVELFEHVEGRSATVLPKNTRDLFSGQFADLFDTFTSDYHQGPLSDPETLAAALGKITA